MGGTSNISGFVLGVVLVASLFSGCLGDGDPPEAGQDYVTEPVLGHVIEHAKNTADPPGYDLLRAEWSETSDDLIVALEVAVLGEGWAHVESGEHAIYWVTWTMDPEWEGVALIVRNTHGVLTANAFHQKTGVEEDCNDWALCRVAVEHEIEYGEPGRIEWRVPRETLLTGREGDHLSGLSMISAVEWGQPGSVVGSEPSTPSQGEFSGGPICQPCGYNNNNPWTWYYNAVDFKGGEDHDFTFSTPMREDPLRRPLPEGAFTTQGADDRLDGHRPDVDLIGTRYRENAQNFTVGVKMTQVEAEPANQEVVLSFGMPSGRVHQAGFETIDDYRPAQSWAGYCEPSEDEDCHWQNHPVEVTREPGTPGWVNFTFALSDLGSPQKGERLNHLQVWTRPIDAVVATTTPELGPLGGAGLYVANTENDDPRFGFGPAHRFGLSPSVQELTTAARERLGLLVADAEGDVQAPTDMQVMEAVSQQSQQDQFDIMYAKAAGKDPETIELSLGVLDLSRVTVPTGYDAMIYAVALETAGQNVMAFYYRDDSGFGYYLAEDTLVSVTQQADPREVLWNEIEGLHSTSGEADQQAGGGEHGGTFTFYVPHELLGVEPGEQFNATALGAGTYLLRDSVDTAAGFIEEVDRASASDEDLPFLLGTGEAPDGTAGLAASNAPLGALTDNAWDILGVVLALVTALLGAMLVWRRRRKLRRYLARVDQAARIDDLGERERALAAIQTEVRDDLVHGRISEGHYTIVLEHVRDAIGALRLRAFDDTFQELPLKLVNQIRAILKDGRITQSEIEAVEVMVQGARVPKGDKEKVLARLVQWKKTDEPVQA